MNIKSEHYAPPRGGAFLFQITLATTARMSELRRSPPRCAQPFPLPFASWACLFTTVRTLALAGPPAFRTSLKLNIAFQLPPFFADQAFRDSRSPPVLA